MGEASRIRSQWVILKGEKLIYNHEDEIVPRKFLAKFFPLYSFEVRFFSPLFLLSSKDSRIAVKKRIEQKNSKKRGKSPQQNHKSLTEPNKRKSVSYNKIFDMLKSKQMLGNSQGPKTETVALRL